MENVSTVPIISADTLCAAEFLEGTLLENGWVVTTKVPQNNNSTGGNFSVPYFVEKREGKTTKKAFLKALNFRRIAATGDFARNVQQHTTAFNFERDTLRFCREKGLKRVATILDAGEHKTAKASVPVCYIIFELAVGDARKQVDILRAFNLAWTLRTLHHIAVGLSQLHTHGIAHQDLKPSNVLFFEAFGAKLSDLGCADSHSQPSQSPRGALAIAGDPSYAPPELFYNEYSHEWQVRRLGCDLYLLGSLILFFFCRGGSMTSILMSKISTGHRPVSWTQDYRSVLPYVRDAFEKSLEEIEAEIPSQVRSDVMSLVRCLCEPDPKLRGHPNNNPGEQFNLERIISAFDLLATKAEFGLVKS